MALQAAAVALAQPCSACSQLRPGVSGAGRSCAIEHCQTAVRFGDWQNMNPTPARFPGENVDRCPLPSNIQAGFGAAPCRRRAAVAAVGARCARLLAQLLPRGALAAGHSVHRQEGANLNSVLGSTCRGQSGSCNPFGSGAAGNSIDGQDCTQHVCSSCLSTHCTLQDMRHGTHAQPPAARPAGDGVTHPP